MGKYTLECCVDSVESALAAEAGGADRLELCAGLIIGGTSPGLALFEQVRESCGLPVRVLLRPRFGDFLYTDYEFRIIRREVELFREAGAEGVVIGCLQADGSLHMEQMKELVETAGGMKITLHRAFDVCADPIRAYEQAWELGIDTILTSGQEKDCLTGLPLLKKLCCLQMTASGPHVEKKKEQAACLYENTERKEQAACLHENAERKERTACLYENAEGKEQTAWLHESAGKQEAEAGSLCGNAEKSCGESEEDLYRECRPPQIMAGAGVTPDVIRQFRAETDITAFHLSAKKIVDSGMRYRREGVPMGLPAMSEFSIFRTDSAVVAQARQALS